MNTLRINHLKNPLGIDITDNNFSFRSNEKGPFRAKILLGVCKGKKTYDKKQTLKERDIEKYNKKTIHY